MNNLPQTTLRGALHSVREFAEEAVADAVTDAVMAVIGSTCGISLGGLGTLGDFAAAGRWFEELMEQGLCGFLTGGGPPPSGDGPIMEQPTTWLRLAVPMQQSNGAPRSDGLGCNSGVSGIARFRSGRGVSYPDFLITGHGFETVRDEGRRTFLVGDVKLSMPSSPGARTRRQFSTMARHASGYSFGFVLVLAFRERGHIATWPVTRIVWENGAILRSLSVS